MPPEMISYIPPRVKQVLEDLRLLKHPAAEAGADIIAAFMAQATPDQMPHIDPETRVVMRGGVSVQLTKTQCTMMEMFLEHYPDLCSVRQLRNKIYGPVSAQHENVIRVMTFQLRKKLLPLKTRVVNVPWSGYRLELEPITP